MEFLVDRLVLIWQTIFMIGSVSKSANSLSRTNKERRDTMKLTQYSKSIKSGVLVLSLLSLLILLGCHEPAADKVEPLSSAPSQLSKDIIGTWVMVGTPGDVGEPPAAGGRLKFRTARHWAMTQADPDTGTVSFHHGGTYTLNGDEYVEKVEYATENLANYIGNAYKYKVKVEGDTFTQIGIENPFTEVWKRSK